MAEDKKKQQDGDEEGAEAGATPPAKGKKKLILIAVGVVFLFLAGGIPAAFILMKPKPEKVEELDADAATHGEEHETTNTPYEEELEDGEEAIGAIVPFETFLVNLSGGKYIRLQAQIEFNTLDVPRKFYSRAVPIRDSIISLLTQKTQDDLGSAKGKEALRTEIKEMINEVLRKEEVKRVYFTQFVIQ